MNGSITRDEFNALVARVVVLETQNPSGMEAFNMGKFGPNPPGAPLYQADMDAIGGPVKLAEFIKTRKNKAVNTSAEQAEIDAFLKVYDEDGIPR